METPESIRASLIPGKWVWSIDLSSAYLHIPIHPNSRKYLRFCHKSQVFQFTSLPVGLATAPQVFTVIVKEVKLMTPFLGVLELKEVSLALQRLNDQCQNQTVLVCYGQLNSSSLYKQTRRDPLGGDVRSPVEDHDLVPSLPHNLKSQTHSRVSECDG